jgi:UDP-N-acetylglucosamine acyltransferase
MIINSFKNLKIGKNNFISPNAIIHDNVVIGDNNNIYDNVIIYPNTIIGNNNVIYNGNTIGEIPIQSNGTFQNYDFSKSKGVEIGNNNFFHIKNIIFGGVSKPTKINNNNKILGENHIGHDCIIFNEVSIYPRTLLCGHVKMLNYSSTGVYSFIHQNKIIGQYSMIGGNSSITKDVFPYFININNNITRLNTIKIPYYIKNYEKILLKMANNYYNNVDLKLDNLPIEIIKDLDIFLNEK